ncbi:uncharacterized protein LOC122503685 isoform X2 [Leptopilina heterotoma]|uniref:uncharacterized protein LOC122503685 isoform X2 n=1 Tax=Leptopilina heterotoma TaxID=63436 RepID=UPI001CA8BE59|nr:uncharacterized protein LOC122503685 isoform X2 [Leptopilina heterotoma]
MIYARFLLWALISAPFTLTLQVQQFLPDHEIKKESEGEMISVKHSIRKRSIPEIAININSRGVDKKYILQSSKGFFAGKRTRIWIAKKIGNKFNYFLKRNIMKNMNITLYRDQETGSAIAHTLNKRGVSEFNGIIGTNKVIRPLNNENRLRRDVSSKFMHESVNNSLKNHHVLYKRDISQSNSENTNLYEHEAYNLDKQAMRRPIVSPHTVYPQILVYVDTTLFLYFKGSVKKTVSYVLTLMNGVDLYFREIEKPFIRLNIAGIVLCEESIEPSKRFIINGDSLDRFSKFMYEETKFKFKEHYDIAVVLVKSFTVQPFKGLAYTGSVCQQRKDFIKSVAIISDNGRLEGIQTGAHELGHVLGSFHDELKYLPEEDKQKCTFKKGFIMSYQRFDQNQFYFSPCSKEQLKLTLSLKGAQCIQNNPADNRNDDQILRIFPGQYLSADKQCRTKGRGNASAIVSPSICLKLDCISDGKKYVIKVGALEGTPCDLGKVCLRGECVKIPYNTDLNLNQLFPIQYLPPQNNKSLEEQCKEKGVKNVIKTILNACELDCIDTNSFGKQIKTFIYAQDGTSCNDIGFCRDGQCIDINFQSANEYCIKAGKKGLKKISEECTFICEKEIYNIPDDFKNTFHESQIIWENIAAPNGFPCSKNRNCMDGKCVDGTYTITTTATTTTIPTTTHTTTSATTATAVTTLNKLPVFKSSPKRCEEIGMSWSRDYDNGCVIICYIKDYNSNKFENNDKRSRTKYLEADYGLPCNNSGYCQEGKCINMTSTTSTIRTIDSTTSTVHTIDSTTAIDKPVKFKSATELCDEVEMSFSSAYNDGCVIICQNQSAINNKEDFDFDQYVIYLNAEIGMPCNNSGTCLEGTCTTLTLPTTTLKIVDSTKSTDKIIDTTTSTFSITDSTTSTHRITESTKTTDNIIDTTKSTPSITESTKNTDNIIDTTTSTLSITDSTTRTHRITDSTTNTVNITDSTTSTHRITESTKTTDNIIDTTKSTPSITESTKNTDNIIDTTTSTLSITESTKNTDNIIDTTTSTLSITDSTTRTHRITDSTTNTVNITDSTTSTHRITESTKTTDNIIDTTKSTPSITESTKNTDNIIDTTTSTLSITDSTTRTHRITDSTTNTVNITDSTKSTPSITESIKNTDNIIDTTTSTLSITDSTTRTHRITDSTTNTVNITDSTTNTVSITGSSTPSNIPVTFRPRIERCTEIGMSLSDIEMECQFLCVKENDNSENSEDNNDYKYFDDDYGFPCNNFGYCENGECANMTAVTDKSPVAFKNLSERCKDFGMDWSHVYNDGCSVYCKNTTNNYDERIVAEDGYPCLDNGVCSEGMCFEYKVTSITPRTIGTTTPLIRSIDEFDSPRKRCKKIQMFLSHNHKEECTIMCTSKNELDLSSVFNPVKDEKNIVTELLTAENGYPCETNKYCLDGKCVTPSTNWDTDALRVVKNKARVIHKDNSYSGLNEDNEQNADNIFVAYDEEQDVDEGLSEFNEDEKNFADDIGIDL